MSQAKVDQYKNEKYNRKQIMAKEKVKKTIAKLCVTVVTLAIVAWAGLSIATYAKEHRPAKSIYCTTTEIDNYLKTLSQEDEE